MADDVPTSQKNNWVATGKFKEFVTETTKQFASYNAATGVQGLASASHRFLYLEAPHKR